MFVSSLQSLEHGRRRCGDVDVLMLMALSGDVLQNPLKKEGAVNGGDESSTQGGICVKLHGQAGVASTDTSCDSAVTGVLPHRATPQHSPRDTSPAG
jgi:homeobox-leucine zipper protein